MYDSPQVLHYWIKSHDQGHNLSVLKGDTLTMIDTINRKLLKETIAALVAGQPIPDKVAKKATNIPVAKITRLQTAEHMLEVKVRYQDENDKEKKIEVMTDEKDQRAEAMTLLSTAMGPDVDQTTEPMPVWQAIMMPGFITLVVIAGTIICYLAAADIDPTESYNPSGRRSGTKQLAHKLMLTVGPEGMLLIGTLLAAGTLAWFYRRMLAPPEQTIVERITSA